MKTRIIIIIFSILMVNNDVKGVNISKFIVLPHLSDSTRIKIFYDQSKAGDTLTLNYYDDILCRNGRPGVDPEIRKDAAMDKDGNYSFAFISGNKLGYYTIEQKFRQRDKQRAINLKLTSLIESGDNFKVSIRYTPSKYPNLGIISPYVMTYQFEGPSAKKYTIINGIDSLMEVTPWGKNGWYDKEAGINEKNIHDSRIKAGLKRLDEHKLLFTGDVYNQLRADIFYGQDRYAKYLVLRDIYNAKIAKEDSASIKLFRKRYAVMSANDYLELPETALLKSNVYAINELTKLQTDDVIAYGKVSTDRIFKAIKSNYHGAVRDKIIAAYCNIFNDIIPDYAATINEAMKVVKSKYALVVLELLKGRVAGTVAYNFHLPNSNGKIVNLSDLQGKIVFIDFWYTGCVHCVSYYSQEVSKAEEFFKNNKDIAFVSICIDIEKKKWEKSIIDGVYTSNKVINLFTDGKGSRHPIIERYAVTAYPHPILLDRKGRILKFGDPGLRKENGVSPLIETLNKALNAPTF